MKTSEKKTQQEELAPPVESAVTRYVPDEDDFVGPAHPEKDPTVYVVIRQKPEADQQTGKMLVEPGGLCFNDPVHADRADAKELIVSILDYRQIRVFFEPDATKPTCKSNDAIHGSRPREGNKYETCATCILSMWDITPENRRPACKEGRALAVVSLDSNELFLFQFTPSGIKPFSTYMAYLKQKAKDEGWTRDGQAAYIGHLRATRIKPEYRADPQPHYVPAFEDMGWVPATLFPILRAARRDAMGTMDKTVASREQSAVEWVGGVKEL